MLVAGCLAAVLNYGLLRGADATRQVAVAAVDLHPGDRLSADAVRLVEVPADTSLPGLLTPGDVAALEGGVLSTRVVAGEPVRAGDLREEAATDGLRAMSIPIESGHAVDGALRAGDRVDVIEVGEGGARYLATDLEVLGVTDAEGGALGGIGGFAVTVAVDAPTALDLAAALRNEALEIVRSTGAAPVDGGRLRGDG